MISPRKDGSSRYASARRSMARRWWSSILMLAVYQAEKIQPKIQAKSSTTTKISREIPSIRHEATPHRVCGATAESTRRQSLRIGYAPLSGAMASAISDLALFTSPERTILTHLSGSKSLQYAKSRPRVFSRSARKHGAPVRHRFRFPEALGGSLLLELSPSRGSRCKYSLSALF